MSHSGIAVRRLAVLLCLPACHTWRPVALAPNTEFAQGAEVRVDRGRDSVLVNRHGSIVIMPRPVVIAAPRIIGDSLLGHRAGSRIPIAVALTEVRRAEQRWFSSPRTALLVVGVVGVAGALASSLASGLNNMNVGVRPAASFTP
jgi:hypothetical protein